jgi:hypothetical protein
VRRVHKVVIRLSHAVVELELLGMRDFAVELEAAEIRATLRFHLWGHLVLVPIVDFCHWLFI